MTKREIAWSGSVLVNFSISMSNVSAGIFRPKGTGRTETKELLAWPCFVFFVFFVKERCDPGLDLDLALDA